MKKLIIEMDIDSSDWEESDIKTFLKEAKNATGLEVMVGRSISEKQSDVVRMKTLSTEYFTARVE